MSEALKLGTFLCPSCGNTTGKDNKHAITRRWYTTRVQTVLGISNGKIVHEVDDTEEELPQEQEREHFRCCKCKYEWSVEDLEFADLGEIRAEREAREKLAALEQTHNALMVLPLNLLPGDIYQLHRRFVHFTHHSKGPKTKDWESYICCHWSDKSFGGQKLNKPLLIWRKK